MFPAVSPYTTFCSGAWNRAAPATNSARFRARPMARIAPSSSEGSCVVHHRVGEAPGQMAIVTQDHGGDAGDRGPYDLVGRPVQAREIPDGRGTEREVRIVGEDRLPGS